MFLASSSQYFILPTTVDLNLINITTGISFSFWARINATGSGNYGRIFDFGQISNVTNGINYILITRDGTTSNLKFEILNNASVVTNTTINSQLDNVWRHYVWTITTTGAWMLYVNNVGTNPAKTQTIPIVALANRTYNLGKSLFSADSYLNMNLDDFRIYNKVLLAPDVNELYFGSVSVYKKSNLGIGTTNPQYLLDINGTTNITGQLTTSNIIKIINNFSKNCYIGIGGNELLATNYYKNNSYIQSDNAIIFNANANVGTNIPHMIINTTGNVGIGTTDPKTLLDVRGVATVGSSTVITSPFSTNVGLYVNNTCTGSGNPQQLVITDTANSNAALLMGINNNSGTAFSQIQSIVAGAGYKTLALNPSGGNVGIGTTSAESKLTIKSAYGDENSGLLINASDVTNTYKLKIYPYVVAASQVGYKFKVDNVASSVEAINISYNGDIRFGGTILSTVGGIGIGSGTPANNGYQLLIVPPAGSAAATIQTIQQGSGYNQNLTLQASGGNVGIGKTPTSKLDVSGGISLTGELINQYVDKQMNNISSQILKIFNNLFL